MQRPPPHPAVWPDGEGAPTSTSSLARPVLLARVQHSTSIPPAPYGGPGRCTWGWRAWGRGEGHGVARDRRGGEGQDAWSWCRHTVRLDLAPPYQSCAAPSGLSPLFSSWSVLGAAPLCLTPLHRHSVVAAMARRHPHRHRRGPSHCGRAYGMYGGSWRGGSWRVTRLAIGSAVPSRSLVSLLASAAAAVRCRRSSCSRRMRLTMCRTRRR